MAWIYSIKTKLLLVFLAAAVIFAGGSLAIILFIHQTLASTGEFVTGTLPKIGLANALDVTARNIVAHTYNLSSAQSRDELTAAFARVSQQLDLLEGLTAKVSQEGGDLNILNLNRLSQSIRSQAQIIYQITNHQFMLKSEGRYKAQNAQSQIALLRAQFPKAESDRHLTPHFEHDFYLELKSLTRSMSSAIDRALYAENTDRIKRLHEGFLQDSEQLARVFRSYFDRAGALEVPQAVRAWLETPPEKQDQFFTTRHKELSLHASTKHYLQEISLYADQLSEETSRYAQNVFERFRQSAAEVIVKQRQVLALTLTMAVAGALFLFLIHWGVVVHGILNRLQVISMAMSRTPTEECHTTVSVKGQDEIGKMARKLEGFLRNSLQVHQLATMDELTQSYNRRHFFELAQREIERLKRHSPCRSTSLMMIDIDHFKQVNDSYGHAIGDKVLSQVAGTCKGATRAIDIFARLGGEEFILLAPETERENGKAVAERIRSNIKNLQIESSETRQVSVTVSIGLAVVNLCETPLEDGMKKADFALYEAKKKGRNCVMVAPSEQTKETQ